MPQLPQATHILDVETAVKGGILGGGGATMTAPEKVDLRRMIDEVEVSGADDVPTVFICPISLEPMLDPVTLCTGQTYERPNILRWFSMGRRTCPTTMQELWDEALTPNRTLHHLIIAWFSQRHLRLKKRAEDVQGRAAELLQTLRRVKGQARVQALRDLHRLVVSHSSTRKTVVDSGGVPLLSSLLGPFTSHAVGSEAVAVLANLPLDADSKTNLVQPAKISLVADLLNEGTIETKINCTRFIEMLVATERGGDFRSEIVSSLTLLFGLMKLIKDRKHPAGAPVGLSLLRKICSQKQVRTLVVSVGAVPQLVELLPALNPDCLEHALQIFDDLAATPEGRAALKECSPAIPNMVRVLMRVSEKCTHSALSVLWTVCKLSPEDCAAVAVEAGLAAKLLLVIQSGCNPALKQRAAELLKLCSLNYTATLFISKCKLTRTIQ